MTAGLGVDLIEIARIERALDRHPRLADRLFTGDELEYSRARARPARHLAARFAAKEAVVKALALGPGTALREIEVVAGAPPQIRMHGEVASLAETRGTRIRLSLSHTREMATAIALAETG